MAFSTFAFSLTVSLTVPYVLTFFLVPPKIGPLLEKTFALLNTTLNLTCLPMGSPPIKILWKKDGSEDIQRAVLTSENQSLTVSQTMLNDSGLYQCNASNDVGFAASETRVLITGKYKTIVIN